MPSKEFDPHDPFDLVGTPVPLDQEEGTMDEMARTVIQEYLMMGWNENVIMTIFRNPTFRGPHTVFRAEGADYIRQLIAEEQEAHRNRISRLFGDGETAGRN